MLVVSVERVILELCQGHSDVHASVFAALSVAAGAIDGFDHARRWVDVFLVRLEIVLQHLGRVGALQHTQSLGWEKVHGKKKRSEEREEVDKKKNKQKKEKKKQKKHLSLTSRCENKKRLFLYSIFQLPKTHSGLPVASLCDGGEGVN